MRLHDVRPHAPIDSVAWETLKTLQPASLGHYLSNGVVGNAIRALLPEKRLLGRAVTLRQPFPDAVPVHVVFDHLGEGDVLVIDRAGDHAVACIGEMTARMGQARRLAGIVVDGVVTDIGELRALGMPIYARGTSIMTTRPLNIDGAELFGPVIIGDTVVQTGDILTGDANGLLAIRPDYPGLEALIARSARDEEREVDWRLRIAAGEALADLNGSRALIQNR